MGFLAKLTQAFCILQIFTYAHGFQNINNWKSEIKTKIEAKAKIEGKTKATLCTYLGICDHMNLKTVPTNVNRAIEVFDLSNNAIEKVDRTHFQNLQNLQILELQHNKIRTIRNDAFSDLTNLQLVDLTGNSIQFFNVRLPHLKYLSLANNPLTIIIPTNVIEYLNVDRTWLDQIPTFYMSNSSYGLEMSNTRMKKYSADDIVPLCKLRTLSIASTNNRQLFDECSCVRYQNWMTSKDSVEYRKLISYSAGCPLCKMCSKTLRCSNKDSKFSHDTITDINECVEMAKGNVPNSWKDFHKIMTEEWKRKI